MFSLLLLSTFFISTPPHDHRDEEKKNQRKQEVTPQADRKQEVALRTDRKQEGIPLADRKQEVIPLADRKQEGIPQADRKQEVIPQADRKQEVIPQVDRKQEVTTQVDRKQEVALQRGDLLVVPRTLFTHFGIYLGGGRVAHFIPDIVPVFSADQIWINKVVTNTRLLLGVLAKCGSVRFDSVKDFAYGSPILVNTTDQVCSLPPLGGGTVAQRAERLRGHVTYSLLWYNCEHFVMFCRYGTVTSLQTFQFCKTVRKLLLSRRVAKATAVLGACLLVHLETVNTCTALMAVLLPFLIWMAS